MQVVGLRYRALTNKLSIFPHIVSQRSLANRACSSTNLALEFVAIRAIDPSDSYNLT